MKLIIADDHPFIHKGLIYFLKETFLDIQIQSVYNGEELLNELKKTHYDIVILDINFPGNENISSVEYIIKNFPDTKIIIFSQNQENIFALRYLRIGASGYVQKSEPVEVLLNAIMKVQQGKKYYNEEVFDALINTTKTTTIFSNPFDTLSNRELEVVFQLLKGNDYKTIADILHISPSTISTYKSRIFEKLQIKNDVDFFDLAKQFLRDYN